MRCCAGFFMRNSLSDPEDLLIPFSRLGAAFVQAGPVAGDMRVKVTSEKLEVGEVTVRVVS
jgi:hypothetical protein